MLRQHGRLEIPGADAFEAAVCVRAARFGIQSIHTRGLITDWGLQRALVRYIDRQTRSQLSIVLEGHGYFESGGRVWTLGPGAVVRSDQRRHDPEGYGGDPSRVLILEWEGDALGPAHRGVAHVASIPIADVRALAAAADVVTDAETWSRSILERLRAVGIVEHVDWTPERAGTELARLYDALGRVRSSLHEHPALPEVAEQLGVSERHARRVLAEMDGAIGTTAVGWREAVGDFRMATAQQLLSIPELPLEAVARRSGFRSAIALCHAFSERAGTTPRALARAIGERWDARRAASPARFAIPTPMA